MTTVFVFYSPAGLVTIPPGPQHDLRKAVAKQRRVRTRELPDSLRRAFDDIEVGDTSTYAWACLTERDARTILRLVKSPAPGRPSNLFEYEHAEIMRLFPADLIRYEVVEAEQLCHHPIFNQGCSAGSMRSEIGHRLPRNEWKNAAAFGEAGIYMVRVQHSALV